MIIKEHLSFEERWAIGNLIELCKDVNLFVDDDEESDWLHTTGETLNLESIDKKDWELCLKALE